ncbi:MAG: putative toxin-antitoxin system toxin component, PIN family [Gammaproteobacteria bacterium]|nr:putative toxin-antitoxin system toxin component, PIN family [Gammaproteobacteria bacterium]
MRIVLDTNVVISALLWNGAPYRLLRTAIERDIDLYTSPILLAELQRVIGREHLVRRLAQQRMSVEQALAQYAEATISISPTMVPQITRDPDDDHVIACALAANVDFIVSGDSDLLDIGTYRGIRILTVSATLELTGSGER